MQDLTSLLILTKELKQNNYKQYITSLFAHPKTRDAIITILLFENEISQIAFKAPGDLARSIRYKWWENALDELSSGMPAKSPLLERINLLQIDPVKLKITIRLFEEIASRGLCETQGDIKQIFLQNTCPLELICKLSGDSILQTELATIYRISFITQSLLDYFSLIDSSYLKPFSLELIEQFSYNPDLIRDKANNDKLKSLVKMLCINLLNELNEIDLGLRNKSKLLKAYIYSVRHCLDLLKKQNYDLRIKQRYNKFIFLLRIFASSF